MTAVGLLTQHAQAEVNPSVVIDAAPNTIRPGLIDQIDVVSSASATGRLGILAEASVVGLSEATSDPLIYKPAFADVFATSYGTAQWARLISVDAAVTGQSTVTAFGFTNAEAPDPASRTMRRPEVDRVMRRPFVNRTMRRQA